MKIILKSVIFLLLFIVFSSSVFAVGVSPSFNYGNIVPGSTDSFKFYAMNTMEIPMNVSIEVTGVFAEYSTISDDFFFLEGKQAKEFIVNLNYPDIPFKPGIHSVIVRITEERQSQGTGIVVRAAVNGRINLRQKYPGKYGDLKIGAKSTNQGGKVPITVTLSNYGTEIIENVEGVITVYFEGEKIDVFKIPSMENIETFESKTGNVYFDTKSRSAGVYKARADVVYDGIDISAETTFNVGIFDIDIVDYTKKAAAGKINQFNIMLESKWNGEIKDLFADINIKKEGRIIQSFKTPNYDIGSREKKSILSYLDATNLEAGEYQSEIFLNYMGKQTIARGKLDILEGNETEGLIFIEKIPDEKSQSPVGILITPAILLWIVSILMIVVILLIAIILFVIFKKTVKKTTKHKKKHKKKKKK